MQVMDEQVYRDRGMMKWQGLILSEHREVLDQLIAEHTREYIAPIQMEPEEIQARLHCAYHEGYRVWLALNQVDLNGIYREMEGRIQGYFDHQVVIDQQCIPLDEIRAIEFVERLKFWQVE